MAATTAMATMPIHFGCLPPQKFPALQLQWPLCTAHTCAALYCGYFTILSHALLLSIRYADTSVCFWILIRNWSNAADDEG